jgi:hypothetical protein
MGAAARIIHFAVLATAVCLGAGGCFSAGGQGTLLDRAESSGSLAPVTLPCPRLVTPVAPPAGFSSTYQKYLMDRQQQARRAEQDVQARTPAKNPSENDGRAQNR